MRISWLLAALLAAALPALAAKPPAVQWTRTFPGWGGAAGHCVQQTSDGGYIVVGTTDSNDSTTGYAVLLVKLYASGDTPWVRTFKAAGGMMGSSVVQTSDGGYIVAGGASANQSHWDPCLLKVNALGNEVWRTCLANEFSANAISVVRLADTAYTVVAQRFLDDSAVILWRTNSSGNLRWSHLYNVFYDLNGRDEELSLRRTSDGGYIIGTRTLLKVDSLGVQQQLIKTFGSLMSANSVIQTSDGGYAATGAKQGYTSIYLLKTNANRDSVWADTFMPSEVSRGHCIEQTSDGGYIIAGTTRPSYKAGDIATLVRTSSNGTQIWTDTLSGSYSGHCIRQTADGGYVVTGMRHDNLYVTKLAPERRR
ncbi:MAG TPA: hypothetical protein VMH22_15375 [bacterium]|nr:hypothetical protein [bacterium]